MYNKKISQICNNSICKSQENYTKIFKIIEILEKNDFPNKEIECNESKEAFKLLKDMLENEESETQMDFDIIYCKNENLEN